VFGLSAAGCCGLLAAVVEASFVEVGDKMAVGRPEVLNGPSVAKEVTSGELVGFVFGAALGLLK